jgi:hypothetical protein
LSIKNANVTRFNLLLILFLWILFWTIKCKIIIVILLIYLFICPPRWTLFLRNPEACISLYIYIYILNHHSSWRIYLILKVDQRAIKVGKNLENESSMLRRGSCREIPCCKLPCPHLPRQLTWLNCSSILSLWANGILQVFNSGERKLSP